MGYCNPCDEPVIDAFLLEHLRRIHPDAFGDGPPRWADGELALTEDHDQPVLSVKKLGFVLPVPVWDDLDVEPVHVPWPRRCWWRVRHAVAAARMRVGSWIAGVDLSESPDWDD